MTDLRSWTILDGLPTTGAMAEPFSATGRGTHSEGLVVRFVSSAGSWVGNFQRGVSSLDAVFDHPDGQHVVVVAGGTAYVVETDHHTLVTHFGADIENIVSIPERRLVLLCNGLWFEALGPTGMAWRSRRISWDGMRRITLAGKVVRGEAYAPEGPHGAWYPFELDVQAGTVRGGSYPARFR